MERELTADESAALSGRRTARGFGGHEHLDRTGLVHMGRRLHDPRLGRFLSPDPYVADPASSQDWNAYSYVANSPLSHADPTGLFRAGPGCNVHGAMCLEADGGGFSHDAQAFEHAATVSVAVPFVETTWHWGYGGWGYGGWGYGGRDRPGVLGGHGFGVPRHTFGLSVISLPHVFAGTLQVDGESPADEPMVTARERGAGMADGSAGRSQDPRALKRTVETEMAIRIRDLTMGFPTQDLAAIHLHRTFYSLSVRHNVEIGARIYRTRRRGPWYVTMPNTDGLPNGVTRAPVPARAFGGRAGVWHTHPAGTPPGPLDTNFESVEPTGSLYVSHMMDGNAVLSEFDPVVGTWFRVIYESLEGDVVR